MAQDAAMFGVSFDKPEPKDFEVLPENWAAVQLFLRCQTQWRTTSAGVCGFDYSAVQWVFRLYEVENPRELLEDLQIMEAAAIEIMNKQDS
jgi:hypothetical protein